VEESQVPGRIVAYLYFVIRFFYMIGLEMFVDLNHSLGFKISDHKVIPFSLNNNFNCEKKTKN
jgi:hypothetical protein